MSMFPPQVVNEFIVKGLGENIEVYLSDYLKMQPHIPGAPLVEALTPDDVFPLTRLHDIDLVNRETWQAFCERTNAEEDELFQTANPFMPSWEFKEEGKTNAWLRSFQERGAPPDQLRERLDEVLAAVQPIGDPRALLGIDPVGPHEQLYLDEVVQAATTISRLFAHEIGHDSTAGAEFRWGPTLSMLSGLGLRAMRTFGRKLAQTDEDWQFWSSPDCDDSQLKTSILEGRRISGYPAALFRADFTDLHDAVATWIDNTGNVPFWMQPVIALHILKYVRFTPKFNEGPAISIAYRTRHSLVPINPDGIEQTLGDPINASVANVICKHLRIPFSTGNRRNVPPMNAPVLAVLRSLRPRDLPFLRDIAKHPHLVVPPGVTISQSHAQVSSYQWANTGIEVSDAVAIDVKSGRVGNTVVTGADALAVKWPRTILEPSDYHTWRANIPDNVAPRRPSEIVREKIKNLNTFGHDEGFNALLDALIFTALLRERLAGSVVGSFLPGEFPLVVAYPTGHTLDTTTNQGKTNLMRIVGGSICPNIQVVNATRSSSAPAQRACAAPIEDDGTVIYDEFVLPSSHDHFMAQSGLQTLATGGRVTPGRAMENSRGVKLRYPLFFTAKIAAFPPDMMSRQLPIFLDTLTADTRASDTELATIMSGKAANLVRLSALMWMEKHDFLKQVRAAMNVSGSWRFTGHYTVSTLLTGDRSPEPINAYFGAAMRQTAQQRLLADESGLTDNIGAVSGFDPAYYLRNASDVTLKTLAERTATEFVSPLSAMRILLEDMGSRSYDRVISSHGGKERSLLNEFANAIKAGRMVHNGWAFQYVTTKDERNRERNGVKVVNTDTAATPAK